mgnify:CR=1 FL=1
MLPADIPVPQDDGGARHLHGCKASVSAACGDRRVAGRSVEACRPHRALHLSAHRRAGQAPPDGWDADPGARGCTPQSCSFRDHFAELKRLGVAHLYGLSTQDTGLSARGGRASASAVPDPVRRRASSSARAIKLPTFTAAGMTLLKRMALVIDDGVITKVFYPVFPPDKNAEDVIAWLRGR